MELKNWRIAAVAGTVLACSVAFAVATGSATSTAIAEDSAQPTAAAPTTVPEADEFGVISAEAWKDIYPLEYNSYLMNATNAPGEYADWVAAGGVDTTTVGITEDTDLASTKANYLDEDQYPEIKTLGKGYGYAKYYTEPAGHVYSLWTVANNGRLGDLTQSKGKVSCYACKTPQIHYEAAASDDAGFWTQPISEYVNTYTENISCANCHVNDDPTQMNLIREDWIRAMGDDIDTVPAQSQVCGQCHCDYSMAPAVEEGADVPFASGEPTSPYYGGVASMTPELALAFYDEYGFSDWTYASTGAQMLAVRHAEFEFNYGGEGSVMANMGYTCADCHMGVETASDGTAYTNHFWSSPLENEAMLEECNTCHTDLVSEVKAIQEDIDGRTHELGLRAEQFIFNFEAKVAIEDKDGNLVFDMDTALANGLTEEQVTTLQKLQREACYYWNLAAAENSEGAHNPALYEQCLEMGNQLLDEADGILGVSSVVEA